MLTKTDCLSDKWNPQSSAIDLGNPHLRDAVFYGMQLFANELAIPFAEFTRKYNNLINRKDLWSTYSEVIGTTYYTTQELFELFLQSINQK